MSEGQGLSQYVLVIDLGTSGPKVGLVDRQGQVACSASSPVQLFFLPEGGAEHDPAEWWSAITSCVMKVIRTAGVPPAAIIAVARRVRASGQPYSGPGIRIGDTYVIDSIDKREHHRAMW